MALSLKCVLYSGDVNDVFCFNRTLILLRLPVYAIGDALHMEI